MGTAPVSAMARQAETGSGAAQSRYCGWSTCQKDYSRSLYLMQKNFLMLHKTIALGLQSLATDKERV